MIGAVNHGATNRYYHRAYDLEIVGCKGSAFKLMHFIMVHLSCHHNGQKEYYTKLNQTHAFLIVVGIWIKAAIQLVCDS